MEEEQIEEAPEIDWQDLSDYSPESLELEEEDNSPTIYAIPDEERKRPPYELNISFQGGDDYLRREKEKITKGEMAAIIERENYFATDAFSKELYVYISHGPYAGTYIEARQSIDWAIKQIAIKYEKDREGHWASRRNMDEVYNWINKGLRILESPEIRHINVMNGLIYLTPKGEFIDFSTEWSPEYLTTLKLPIYYIPEAKCSRWEKFVSGIFPSDSQHIAWEIAALLMVPLKNKAASGIILKGEKNTGKTTFQNGILALLGEQNTCNLSIEQFGERFQNSQLKDKLANVVGDLKSGKLSQKAVATIKQLIGNDRIAGESKFGASYSFRPYARNLFSCNDMPTCDSDDAFFDRFLIIPFNHVFDKNPAKEKELNETLGSNEELSGLFNKALAALPKVIAEGIKPTPSMMEEHNIVVAENDPLNNLIAQCDLGLGYATPCSELHQFYIKLEPNDWNRKSNMKFGRDFKKLFPEISRKQLMIGGARIWCYVGIKISEKRVEDQAFDDNALELEFEENVT